MRIDKTAIVNEDCVIRHKDCLIVGAYSIIDNYSYFSTRLELGDFCHIAPNCTFAGGKDYIVKVNDFTGFASGTRIYCVSDNFPYDLVNILPEEIHDIKKSIKGDVIFERYCGTGACVVVMPNNHFPEGVAIGAMSFVPSNFKFEPWSVYAGIPIKKVCDRKKESVMNQVEVSLQWKLSQKKII